MSKWVKAALLLVQTHFAASYMAPTLPGLGAFNYVWPWAIGDAGLFGHHPTLLGIAFAGVAALASFLALLAVLEIAFPRGWWRHLAMVGAALELILMIGYFAPTKLLAMALDVVMLVGLRMNWIR